MKHSILLVAAWLIGLPITAQAGEAIRLPNRPSLSPDGSLIAFEWNGDIWSVPSTGGAARQLTQHPARDREPMWSPDGKQIAFVSDREGSGMQAYVMSAEGGTPKQLTHHSSGCTIQGWTPDGQRLLIHGTRDFDWRRNGGDRFFFVSANDRSAEELLFDDFGRDGSLSPDGKKLLFTREGTQWWRKGYHGSQSSQIWGFDTESKSMRKILDPDRGALWPMWKADGKGFYYVGGQSGSYNLWDYDFVTGENKQLTKFTDDSVVYPTISRDGSTIVFRHLFDLYRLKPGNGEPQKIVIELNTDRQHEKKDKRTLTTATQAAFTADGLEIAFIAGGDLWVMDTELREPKQVTSSPEEERSAVFAPDGESIIFSSDVNGVSDIWRAEKSDKSKYWFQNAKFNLSRITDDGAPKQQITYSPDGSKIAFLKGRGELWIMDADGKNAKKLLGSFSGIEYDWSPDSKWMAVSMEDQDFNRDVYIVPIDGSRAPFNVSRSPDNESNPTWSPDGKIVAFVGKHNGTETDIHYVWLRADDDQTSNRDRSVDKALDKLNKIRKPQSPGSGRRMEPSTTPKDESGSEPPKDPMPPARPMANRSKAPEVVIDFDRLPERVKIIANADSDETNLFWSPDGKKLAFTGSVGGNRGTYYVEFPDVGTPKQLSSQTGSQAHWLKSPNQVVWLNAGVPAAFTPSASGGASPLAGGFAGARGGRGGAGRPPAAPTTPSPTSSSDGDGPATGGYTFRALQEVDLPKKYAAAFDLAWRTMRDNWYDSRLGNRDWNAVRAKYIDVAEQCPDSDSLATVVNLMLGELNGSHLGFTPISAGGMGRRGRGGPPTAEPSTGAWREETAHLGVRFDPLHRGPGWKVRDVIPDSPADHKKCKILAGETVLAIDGVPVDSNTDLSKVLNGPPNREVRVKVAAADGKERDVTIRPTTYAAVRQLLYQKWLHDNRAAVEKLSGGKLGYIHIDAMSMPSFYKFEKELYNSGAGKEGLVIDVRENGGGATADRLLTALTQPVHAITVPRNGTPGYPQDRKVYTTWDKPIVVMCNQNSFSNAEIFSHAVKTLNRGKLVGVPTAGGVVSTGAAPIMDVGMLRLPFRGWFKVSDGEDMELNGAVPDYIVWPEASYVHSENDPQIAKAVEVLAQEVQAWKTRPQPPLRKATERKN